MSKYTPPKKRVLKSKTGKVFEGITQTTGTTTFSTGPDEDPEEIKAFFESIPTPEKAVLDHISKLEQFAKKELLAAGLNPEDEFSELIYKLPDGRKGNYEAAIQERELEPEWYAGKILTEARLLKKFIAEGDLFSALRQALLMERARADLDFSKNFELKVARAEKSSNGYQERTSQERVDTLKEWLTKNPEKIKGYHTMPELMKLQEITDTRLAENTVRKYIKEIYPTHLKAGRPSK